MKKKNRFSDDNFEILSQINFNFKILFKNLFALGRDRRNLREMLILQQYYLYYNLFFLKFAVFQQMPKSDL